MKVIGLGHYSRTGKDSLANRIVAGCQKRGLKAAKMPFAWKLKQIAYDLYAWDGLREPEFYDTPGGEKFRDIVLPTIGKTPVQLWVDIGTPAFRDQVYKDTWIDFVLRGDHGVDVLVIPDTRFFNECEAVRESGGLIAKVVRPGYGPRPTVADRALVGWSGWDYVIGASGQMSELDEWGERFADHLAGYTGRPYQPDHRRTEALEVEEIRPWMPPAGWIVPEWYPDKYLANRRVGAV